MNLQFQEMTIILLILGMICTMLLFMKQSEMTNEKLEKSYPADVKNLIEQMAGLVVNLAAKSDNKVDDQGAALLVAWLKGQGIEINPTPTLPKHGEGEVKPVKAPEIA